MLMLLLALLNPPPVSDPPPVRAGSWVVPKTPRDPELPVKHPWDVVFDRVTAGEVVWVSVGEDYPDAIRIDNAPTGRGVFKCFRENGRNVVSQLVKPAPVQPLVPRLFNPPLFPVIGGT